jgi:putative nucleotidyltransferase with HDIG domain
MSMVTEELHGLISNSCTLPPMPVVATRVMRELMSPGASADSISKIIETDQALVTRILKISNSAFYGCARKVGSIQLAIVVLGFNTLKNLVIATSTKSLYHQQSDAEQGLWEHSLGVGVASHVLAIALCPACLEDAFTIGLLHDLGKLILYTKDPEGYSRVLAQQKQGRSCHESEREAYGFSHADVGAVLASKWNLPETFEAAIGLHHSLDRPAFNKLTPRPKQLTALVRLANNAAKRAAAPPDEDLVLPTDGLDVAMATFKATDEHIDSYVSMIRETLEAERSLFAV